jgi:hypothetical protein
LSLHKWEVAELNVIYHYTDTAGFQGIIAHSRIRASHWAYLNDLQEGVHAARPLRDVLHAEFARRSDGRSIDDLRWGASDPGSDSAPVLEDYRTAQFHFVTEYLEGFIAGVDKRDEWDAYCVSFARVRDELSLWRGYAGAGGFAIGFDLTALASAAKVFSEPKVGWGHIKSQYGQTAVLSDIEYGDTAPIKLAQEERDRIASDQFGPYLTKDVALQFGGRILPRLLSVKNGAFESERETRIIQSSIGRLDPSTRPHYRAAGGLLIPFRELMFSPEAVVEVVLGPGGDAVKRRISTTRFLRDYGFGHAVVASSSVPLAP